MFTLLGHTLSVHENGVLWGIVSYKREEERGTSKNYIIIIFIICKS